MSGRRQDLGGETKEESDVTTNPVGEFFAEWQTRTQGKWFISAWKDKNERKATDSLTCEDIVWHAMKNPPTVYGRGGNRSAQILYSKYEINVGVEQTLATGRFQGTSRPQSAELFSEALRNVQTEKEIIVDFLQRPNETKNITTNWIRTRNYWNGIDIANLRLVDIIRYKRKQTGSPLEEDPQEEIEEKFKEASFKMEGIDVVTRGISTSQTEEASAREKIIYKALEYLDKEAEIVEDFLQEHDKKRKEKWISLSHIDAKAEPTKTSLASLIDGSRKKFFSPYSYNRSHSIFKEKFNIETRDTTKTPEELAKMFVQDSIRRKK